MELSPAVGGQDGPAQAGFPQLQSSVTQQSTPPCWPEAVNRPHLWPLRTVQGTCLCFSHPFRELFTCLRQTLSVPSTEGHKNLAPLIHRTDQFNVLAYGSWPASCFTYLVSLCRAGRNHDTILLSSAPELLGVPYLAPPGQKNASSVPIGRWAPHLRTEG